MSFEVVSADGTEFLANLLGIVQHYAEAYFKEMKPIPTVEFTSDLDGAARCFPEIDRIEVHRQFEPFSKLCRFLVLHELINIKLFKIHSKKVEYDSPEFQAELKRLWDAGAYSDIL